MARSRSIPTNADLHRRCLSELSNVHQVDYINSLHKRLGCSPERFADLVGTLVFGSAYERFSNVITEFLNEGSDSELGRLAGLVVPEHSGPELELFPGEIEQS